MRSGRANRANPLAWPPVWLALFAALTWAAGALWPASGLPVAGAVLIALGLILMTTAALTMLAAGATVDPTRTPTALVTHGVFRRSRNPIYLADALILAGMALRWQPGALILVPVFLAVLTRRFVRPEEAALRARDPAGFAAWSARTRRWL